MAFKFKSEFHHPSTVTLVSEDIRLLPLSLNHNFTQYVNNAIKTNNVNIQYLKGKRKFFLLSNFFGFIFNLMDSTLLHLRVFFSTLIHLSSLKLSEISFTNHIHEQLFCEKSCTACSTTTEQSNCLTGQ